MEYKTLSQELDEVIKTSKENGVELLGADVASIVGSLVSARTSPNMGALLTGIMAQYSKGQQTCGDDCQCAPSPDAEKYAEPKI